MNPRQLLIVEDEHALGKAIDFAVRRTGHLPSLAASGAAAMAQARKTPPDAAIIDIGLPDMSGLDLIQTLRSSNPALPVLVITAHGTLDHAIAARKNGATDYMVKPLDLKQLESTVNALLAGKSGADVPPRASEKSTARPLETSGEMIGSALCLRRVFEGISRACIASEPVLITGPSGSGKALAAQVIHANSLAKNNPLTVLECSSIESETVLDAQKEGAVLLKEVTELTPRLQRHLAEALGKESGPRWLATSSLSPSDAMRQGSLRPELYYALSALHLELPSLQQRTSDIPALTAHFLPDGEVAPAAMSLLQAYEWPGNVRELKHVLGLASALAGKGKAVLPCHLPPHLAESAGRKLGPLAPAEMQAMLGRWLDGCLEAIPEEDRNYDQLLDQLEGMVLQHLLSRFEDKPTYLANALRMNRTTLRQKLRRLGLVESDEA